MKTQLLGQVEIDGARLAADLELSSGFSFPESYPEFSCGRPWRACVLWAPGHESGHGVIGRYDMSRPSGPTPYGTQLPYIMEVIEKHLAWERLLFARLAVMSNDVFVPHRDYVELADMPSKERASYRVHLPLVTHEDCLFIEEDVVFRMLHGELWVLNVGHVHSAGVLSERERIHLLLDFDGDGPLEGLLRAGVDTQPGIGESHRVDRSPLSPGEHEANLSLADVIDLDNLYQVIGILTKKTYRRHCSPNYVWDTMSEIADRSGNPALATRIKEMYTASVLERAK